MSQSPQDNLQEEEQVNQKALQEPPKDLVLVEGDVCPYLYIRYFEGCQLRYKYFRIQFILMCNEEFMRIYGNNNKLPLEVQNCLYHQELLRSFFIDKLQNDDHGNKVYLQTQCNQNIQKYNNSIPNRVSNVPASLNECYQLFRIETKSFIKDFSLKVIQLHNDQKLDQLNSFFYFCFWMCRYIREILNDENIYMDVFGIKMIGTSPSSLLQRITICDTKGFFHLGERIRTYFQKKDSDIVKQ